ERVLLDPGFQEPPAGRRHDVGDSLRISDEVIGITAVGGKPVDEKARARPAYQPLSVDGELEIEVVEVGGFRADAARDVSHGLPGVEGLQQNSGLSNPDRTPPQSPVRVFENGAV